MNTLRALGIVGIIFIFTACGGGGGGGEGGGGDDGSTSAALTIDFPGASVTPQAPLGQVADVVNVTVDVFDGIIQIASQQPLTENLDGSWSGSIANLPIGPVLDFIVHAYNGDAAPLEIFSGTARQVLTGGDVITVVMNAVDDGLTITFPRVGPVTLPDPIDTSADASILVNVAGNSNEVLSFLFVVDSANGGTFSTMSGIIKLAVDGTGTIPTTYLAPAVEGSYDHHVLVTNPQGNSVRLDFSTNVVASAATATLNLLWSPSVISLNGRRIGSEVYWTAKVSDDQSTGLLTYAWDFTWAGGTPGALFSYAGSNPGILSGYDQSVTGTIDLTVTDGDGLSTTVSFTLPAGQFPDTTVITSPPTKLEGSWSICWLDGATDLLRAYTFTGDLYRIEVTRFPSSDASCSGTPTLLPAGFGTFKIGADVPKATLKGTPVTATELDVIDGGNPFYTIFYIDTLADPNVLYFGDDLADPLLDGSDPTKRPLILQAEMPYQKQLVAPLRHADALFPFDDFTSGMSPLLWSIETTGTNSHVTWNPARFASLSSDNTVSGLNERARMQIIIPTWTEINAVAADFTVHSYSDPTGAANGRWFLSFYNDNFSGTAPFGSIDDIIVGLEIRATDARYFVRRCIDLPCSTFTDLQAPTVLAAGLTMGHTYTLFVGWDGATTFTFQLDSQTPVTFDAATVGSSYVSLPNAMTKNLEAKTYAPGPAGIEVWVDNVMTSTVWP